MSQWLLADHHNCLYSASQLSLSRAHPTASQRFWGRHPRSWCIQCNLSHPQTPAGSSWSPRETFLQRSASYAANPSITELIKACNVSLLANDLYVQFRMSTSDSYEAQTKMRSEFLKRFTSIKKIVKERKGVKNDLILFKAIVLERIDSQAWEANERIIVGPLFLIHQRLQHMFTLSSASLCCIPKCSWKYHAMFDCIVRVHGIFNVKPCMCMVLDGALQVPCLKTHLVNLIQECCKLSRLVIIIRIWMTIPHSIVICLFDWLLVRARVLRFIEMIWFRNDSHVPQRRIFHQNLAIFKKQWPLRDNHARPAFQDKGICIERFYKRAWHAKLSQKKAYHSENVVIIFSLFVKSIKIIDSLYSREGSCCSPDLSANRRCSSQPKTVKVIDGKLRIGVCGKHWGTAVLWWSPDEKPKGETMSFSKQSARLTTTSTDLLQVTGGVSSALFATLTSDRHVGCSSRKTSCEGPHLLKEEAWLLLGSTCKPQVL